MSEFSRAESHVAKRQPVERDSNTASRSLNELRQCWPSQDQQQLLRALYSSDDDARAALDAWLARLDLDRLDTGSLNLMPLLHDRVGRLGARTALDARLRGAYRYHWCRNQLALRGYLSVIRRLERHGIRSVALKGMAALRYYGGDVGLRPMSDGDVLVPHARALDAIDVLLEAGWRLRQGIRREDLPRTLDRVHGCGLALDGIEIDVHWNALLEHAGPRADESIWCHATGGVLLAERLTLPSDTDFALHVAVHGARWCRRSNVYWVTDLMQMLRAGSKVDWRRLASEARARWFQLPLAATLAFITEVLGADVPADVLLELNPTQVPRLFWLEFRAMSVDPRRTNSVHRAAAQMARRIRNGEIARLTQLPVELRS